ncbi:MAG: phosphate regulon sensor histidine kinase PhoR [Deferrisomatales bacterium]
MPRTLFAKLFLRHLLLVLAVLVAAGWTLDRFLAQRELGELEARLSAQARLASLDLPPAGGGLQEAVTRRARAAGVRLTVIDSDGRVLADSHKDPARMDNHATRPEVAAALGGRPGREVRRSASLGVEMLYVARPGPPVVRAALPTSEIAGVLWEIRRRVLLAAAPALGLALALAWAVSRALTRRLSAMGAFASGLAAGEFGATLPVKGDDELADLERNLNALGRQLRRQVGALTRDQERLRALVDGLPDAVLVLDGAGELTVANRPARELLRLDAAEIEGLPGAEVLRHPRILQGLDRCLALPDGEAPFLEPFRVSWPDPPRELQVDIQALPDASGGRGVLVVLRDFTEQARLEQARRDFIANLSHELRTPLTAIRGAAETLLDAALSDPRAARRFLETIRRHSLRLEALLSDVTELARIEAGAASPRVEPLDARQPVRQVLELFASEAERAGVAVEGRLPEGPLELRSDPVHLETILVNLVQNAVRYTPEGGRVTVAVEPSPRGVVYRVEDTGIGIPPKDLPRITERFYRVDPGRSRAQGGTGLGLSIVKHLVERLGGELTIESAPRHGTRVRVEIPGASG